MKRKEEKKTQSSSWPLDNLEIEEREREREQGGDELRERNTIKF